VKLSLIGVVLRQVRSSLRHLFWTHVLTSGTMAMTLFVFGAFMLLQVNLERLLKIWGDEIQITAYLNSKISAGDVQALLKRIEGLPEVAQVRYINQEQAWHDFQTALGTQSGLLDGLPRDVLPASLEITLKPSNRDSPVVEQFAERLKTEKEIASVEYPQQWVERLGWRCLPSSGANGLSAGYYSWRRFSLLVARSSWRSLPVKTKSRSCSSSARRKR